MNPRQRRLRRQRRKARARDAEEARLELVELKRKADSVARQVDRSRERQSGILAQNIAQAELARQASPEIPEGTKRVMRRAAATFDANAQEVARDVLTRRSGFSDPPPPPEPALYPVEGAKPSGGALLAAMLKGEKA